MPENLVIIVFAQAALFVALILGLQHFGFIQGLDWPIAIGVGVGFGMLMDLVLGAYGIFGYHPAGHASQAVNPRDLPLHVLLFNAFASYGLASLSIATIAPHLVVSYRRTRNWSVRLGLVTTCGLLAVMIVPDRSVAMMFAWGIVIVGAGELALYVGGKTGPVLAFVAAKNYWPLLRLVSFSATVGISYESTNLAFPFWEWLPGSPSSKTTLVALVALVGYVALFHPMAALYVILTDRPPLQRD